MADLNDLRGIIPALLTPVDASGGINEAVVPRFVRFLLDRKVGGLFVGGSSGDGFMLTADERKRLAEIVIGETGGAVPVVIHVGAMDLRLVCDLTRHACRSGASAVSSVLPFYYRYSIEEIRNYFMTIAESSDLPLLVYVLQQTGGIPGSPEEFAARVLSLRGVSALKYTGTNPYEFWRLLQHSGKDIHGYSGDEKSILPMLLHGSRGAIGTNYCAYPELFMALHDAYTAGDLPKAVKLNHRMLSFMTKAGAFPVFGRVCEALRLRGINVGEPRPPHPRLTPAQCAALRVLLDEYELL